MAFRISEIRPEFMIAIALAINFLLTLVLLAITRSFVPAMHWKWSDLAVIIVSSMVHFFYASGRSKAFLFGIFAASVPVNIFASIVYVTAILGDGP